MSHPTGNPNSTSEAQATPNNAISTDGEMAQAFKDLTRGEHQAAALEANLTNLENRLDALLAAFEGGSAPNDEATGQGKNADSTREQKNPKKES